KRGALARFGRSIRRQPFRATHHQRRPFQLARRLSALSLLPVFLRASIARAHPAISASAILRIESNRRVTMLLSFDALAFVLDETPRNVSDAEMFKLLDGPDAELTKNSQSRATASPRCLRFSP